MTTKTPDDFTFSLDDNDDIGDVMPMATNQSNPFNLSDLSSTLPPSLMPDNAADSNNEVGVHYIRKL